MFAKFLFILLYFGLISRPMFAIIFPEKSYYWGKPPTHPQPKAEDIFLHRTLGVVGLIIMSLVWALQFLEPFLS